MNDDLQRHERRALLLAPTAKDAAVTQANLALIGVPCTSCANVAELRRELEQGVGVLVMTEHAGGENEWAPIIEFVRRQPPWSDLPVLFLTSGGAHAAVGRRAVELLGNVTVLERPLALATMSSVVGSLLRSRLRQYQSREHLRELERTAADLRREQERFRALAESERVARGQAERNGRLKDEFLATLSHELRTPLNAILGWSQLLLDMGKDLGKDTGPGLDENLTTGLAIIERNARAQTRIVEDLLDMSRIINGKLRLEIGDISVAALLAASLETVRPAAEAKQIQLDTVLDPEASAFAGDAQRLQQVLWNLLSNAIKFTPRGGKIKIAVTRNNEQIEVKVADTGEGLSAEFLPHVFDPFRQAEGSPNRSHGGLGLGLAIARQLVQLHGGTISAASQGRGKGSTFSFALPVAPAHPEPALAAAPHDAEAETAPRPANAKLSLHGVKVLVVDDQPDALQLVRRLLEGARAQVLLAGSAAEALPLLMRERPTVLVSDIGMPQEDGFAFIRRVRGLDPERGGETPALALTAYARTEDATQSLQSGFQMHLTKPIQARELVTAIAALAGRSEESQLRLVI